LHYLKSVILESSKGETIVTYSDTVIDRESAERALAALSGDDAITGEALANALANVLARKLGRDAPPLDQESENLPASFERFFDVLIDVAYEEKPLATERVIELVERAAEAYRQRAKEDREAVHEDPDDDSSALYEEDAAAYDKMAEMLRAGDLKGAVAQHRDMDSFTRDQLWGETPQEDYELQVFFHTNS
jgi:hypothetical protein